MISISSNLAISPYSVQGTPRVLPSKNFKGKDNSDMLSKGNKALNENMFKEALRCYKEANSQNSDDLKVYKQMAKAQFGLKDYAAAEENFKIWLEKNPEDIDVIIELGETQRQMGHYKDSLNSFEKAYELDDSNDLARRSILTTQNNLLSVFAPERARREKAEYAQQNLMDALDLTVDYLTPEYMEKLKDVTFQFGQTASMGGTGNIAQYENAKNSITVSNSYIYASPQVIAAYLSHESVHAHDNDPYTSVKEEQDAYEIATKFWIKNSNGIKDPEMDYAADLYRKSPVSLRNRVEEIYTLRDPSIAKTSPNHPPLRFLNSGKSELGHAASQSIKTYDVIA